MKKVLLTGAPCSGKSEMIKRLVEYYSIKTKVIWSKEAISELKDMGFFYEIFNDTYSFQRLITGYQINKERIFDQSLNGKDCLILLDRGVFDGFAYIDDQSRKKLSSEFDLYNWQYDIVLLLQSAYTKKEIPSFSLPDRRESVDRIQALEKRLKELYEERFDNVFWIEAEKDWESKGEKVIRLLDKLYSPMG